MRPSGFSQLLGVQGPDAYFEQNCEGSTARAVDVIENVLISVGDHDIREYESKRILKLKE